MNKIGFQNFRRFLDLQPIEYKGVTFLVGRNNAGKSTLAKALLLIHDFFRSGDVGTFSFGNKILEDANIVTYGRARNKKAARDFIQFHYEFEEYTIEIIITGEDDKTFARVNSLSVIDRSKGFRFFFTPLSHEITISKDHSSLLKAGSANSSNIEYLNNEIQRLRAAIERTALKKTSKEYISLVEELSSVEKKRELLSKAGYPPDNKISYTYTTAYSDSWQPDDIVNFALAEVRFLHDSEFQEIQEGSTPSGDFVHYRGIKEDQANLERSFKKFYDSITSSSIIYLGANPAKQSALFSIRDKNNTLAQSIHDFYQLRIQPGEAEYLFVEKWMKIFEVGDTFTISIRAGEAYEVQIASNNTTIHLADKGMGSIQAMLLLLRLASVIRKINNKRILRPVDTRTVSGLIFIEEPELNLHPALQSKLAELVLEAHLLYHFDFIIETHSEYILRKSQVIVAENEYETAPNENPFCVYYFPKEPDQAPYRLGYNEDGTFNRNFGNGFFDEASLSTLELLRLKRQNRADV